MQQQPMPGQPMQQQYAQPGQPMQQQYAQPVQVQSSDGCMPSADVDVSESSACTILALNILFCPLGTFVASCMDRKGCNMSTACLAILQILTAPLCLAGYIWSIVWAMGVKDKSAGKM